jgi:hypothetical protein
MASAILTIGCLRQVKKKWLDVLNFKIRQEKGYHRLEGKTSLELLNKCFSQSSIISFVR